MSQMEKTLTAAVVQMSSTDDVAYNLEQARHWVTEAARAGATLVSLPEYFCWIGNDEAERVALAETPGDGPIQQALAQLARETGTWLIGGTVPIRPAGPRAGTHAYNTSLLFDPAGECRAGRFDRRGLRDADRAFRAIRHVGRTGGAQQSQFEADAVQGRGRLGQS